PAWPFKPRLRPSSCSGHRAGGGRKPSWRDVRVGAKQVGRVVHGLELASRRLVGAVIAADELAAERAPEPIDVGGSKGDAGSIGGHCRDRCHDVTSTCVDLTFVTGWSG